MLINCTKCSLYQLMPSKQCVSGVGNASADIMIVGEALGENEAKLEHPFVGPCGKLLTNMLQDAGINRTDCYITNTVKGWPHIVRGKFNKNRPPSDDEIKACKEWLWKEIVAINPKVIVACGKIPTHTLLSKKLKKSFKLTDVVGKIHTVDYMKGVIVPIYHPSYLMQYSKSKIQETIEILQNVKRLTEI